MTSRTRVEDSEPLSPELVLVSSPELAQVARERLSSPAAAVAEQEPHEYTAAPADEVSVAPSRPMPPPYPRPAIRQPAPEPERHRRRGRTVAAVVAVAALAAAGAAAALSWGHFLSTPKDGQAPVLPPSEVPVTTLASGAPAGTASAPAKIPLAAPARPHRPRQAHENQPRKQTGAKPPSAARTGVFVPGRTWGWSTSKGAGAYLVRFFLNGREVFKARTAKNRLVLPRSFRFAAGRYRWTVRPATGPPSKRRYGHTIIDSSFVLTRAVAVRANRG